MNKIRFYKYIIVISIFFTVFILYISNKNLLINTVESKLSNNDNSLITNFLKTLDTNTLNIIGISQKNIATNNISEYDVNIITNKDDNYYIILHNINKNNNKQYLTVFKKGFFKYRQIGNAIEQNNILDIFIFPTQTKDKHIIFTRDLEGFETTPLDLIEKLQGFVYNSKTNSFDCAIEIIENAEEYQTQKVGNNNVYKKFRTKSDVMLTSSSMPTLEVLTHYYEAISDEFSNELSKTTPYNLNFTVIKNNNEYNKYFYDDTFNHFILGYIIINDTNEKVGILKKNIKIIDNNYEYTYTIIKKNGQIFEVFKDFTIL